MRLAQLKYRKRRGGYTLEMAFMLPLVLLFLFAILEYGRYVMTRNQLENAVREAARVAAARTNDRTTAEITAIVNNYMALYNVQVSSPVVAVFKADPVTKTPLDANDIPTVIANAPFNNAKFGQGICVQVTGTYNTLFGGIALNQQTSARIGASFPVNVFSIMYSEGN
ncbi:MAG: pilus assembly protein [Planctomycetia bacterium]|nr:pilus assembly protein [Planctomycetia bacterium]